MDIIQHSPVRDRCSDRLCVGKEQEMTREVAIKAIQDFIGWFKEDSLIRKALDMAIQALSQESVLEQIQADIYEEFMTIDGGVHDKSAIKCMELIDKYKGDKE